MKRTFFLLLSGILLASCSSDDDSGNNNNNNIPSADFMPLSAGNYWVYDVNSEFVDGRDSLYTSNDTVIAQETYTKFKTDGLASGFFTNALSNNGVRQSGDKLLLSGTLAVNFSEEFPLSFELSNFTIFKENAQDGELLSTMSGTLQQEVQGFMIEFDYTLTTTAGETMVSYTVPGQQQYNNVKAVETKLNLKATINMNGFEFDLMNPQDVIVSTQYYAENIGVVHIDSNLSYDLENPFGVELPIPQSGSEHRQEILVNYSVE